MNRSLILFAALLLTCNLASAQTEKGNQTLGADLSLFLNTSNDQSPSGTNSKTTDFGIGPTYSYFIADNWAISANASYASSVSTYTYNDPSNVSGPAKTSSKNYSATVALQRYFLYKNKIGLRVGLYTGLGHISENFIYPPTYQTDNNSNSTNYVQGGVDLSLVYYPAKCLGVSLLLGNLQYEHYTETYSQQGNSKGSNFNLGFRTDEIALSLFYVFGGKG